MSIRPAIVPTYATDVSLTGGDETGLAPRLDPTSGIRAQGFYSNRRLPARCLSWMFGTIGDWIGYFDQNAIHGPLQTWRKVVVSNVNATVYSMIAGARQNNATGLTAGADAQRLPVVAGQAFGDSNKLYINRGTDGLDWETTPAATASTTLAVSTSNPFWAGAASVLVASNGPATIYTPNFGTSWSTWTTGFSTNVVGGHFALGINTYLFATANGTIGYTTILAGTPNTASLPGGVAITNSQTAEFADDGGSVVVLLAHVASNAFPSLFYSTNSGATWTKALDMGGTGGNVVHNKTLGLFVAWDTTGRLKSSSNGSVWVDSLATSATSSNGVATGRGSMAAAGPAIVKLCSGGTFGGNGIAYTLDLGSTWNRWTIGGYSSVAFRAIKGINGRLYAVSDDSLWVSAPLSVPSVGDF